MELNPFGMRGPDFLIFFIILSAILVGLIVFTQFLMEQVAGSKYFQNILDDAYSIAYLSGGKDHMLSVAVLSLMDRGLLRMAGGELKAAGQDAVKLVRRPIEKAVLQKFLVFASPNTVYHDDRVGVAAETIGDSLRGAGLLPDQRMQQTRNTMLVICIIVLWIVGLIKIFIALERGRHNILFLCGLMLLLPIAMMIITRRQRTRHGNAALNSIRKTYKGLKERRSFLKPGGATNELELLIAAYGFSQLPLDLAGTARKLKLRSRTEAQTAANSGGCGGGCGSSGGCGGGGGCGSGCGGCGS